MMLVWKLLRRHISMAQLAGFFLANLLGMVIVLLSVQFYNDVLSAYCVPGVFCIFSPLIFLILQHRYY